MFFHPSGVVSDHKIQKLSVTDLPSYPKWHYMSAKLSKHTYKIPLDFRMALILSKLSLLASACDAILAKKVSNAVRSNTFPPGNSCNCFQNTKSNCLEQVFHIILV